ncbi:MAG: hypothetical protein L6W00_12140 [Lentisphaeria bacterium]|nr:MAG: hypothetical protein L6W00_12140 [Lentisphaeria bacterium]
MIIDLKFKNWMSFRDETEFSLVATEERRLKNRVPQIRKSPVLNISPVAVLYGGMPPEKQTCSNYWHS